MTATRPVDVRSRVNETDLRVKRTRKLLKDAFVELLSERSFNSISVQDIAERAMVNRATFYLHFEDKYRLFDFMMRDMFRQIVDKHLPAGSTFSRSNLRLLILATLEAFEEINQRCTQPHEVHAALRPLVLAAVQEGLHEQIDGWLRQLPHAPFLDTNVDTKDGDTDSDASATAAMALSWAIFGAGMSWGAGTKTQPAGQVADQVARLLIDGLTALVPAAAID